MSEKEKHPLSFRCQNNDRRAPPFIYRKHIITPPPPPSSSSSGSRKQTNGPLLSLSIVPSCYYHNQAAVLRLRCGPDLWPQLTRGALKLAARPKNVLGTLRGDFSAVSRPRAGRDVAGGTGDQFLVRMPACRGMFTERVHTQALCSPAFSTPLFSQPAGRPSPPRYLR